MAMARLLAFALFLVIAIFLELAFNLAIAIPIFFLVFAVMFTAFAVAAFIFPGVGKNTERS